MVSAGLESERQALGTKSEVRRPVSLLLVRGHGIALWEEPRGAACWAYPCASAALRSAALYGARAGRELRAFVQTTRPRTLPRPVHGSTGPQVRVQSGPRSGPRSGGSRRSAAAPRLTLSVTPSVRTAAARAPRIPTRRPADTTGSNLMRIAMFAWYLEINRLIIRRKKRHSSIWIHGVKPFVCTKITPDEA
jgi:hypothetical protein